jgi:hypothetical protein
MAAPVGCSAWFGTAWRATPETNLCPLFFFLLFDVLKDSVQIVIEPGSVGVADTANLFHNRIVHGFDSKGSSGVQIIGAFSPLEAQTDSINGRIVALAKCRQFHVNKYNDPLES